MQTSIIWIASVICLMIHIPRVYGAAASRRPSPIGMEKEPDSSQSQLRRSSRKNGQCKAFKKTKDEVVDGVKIRSEMCRLPFTDSSRLAYLTKIEESESVAGDKNVSHVLVVTCNNKQYVINDDGVKGIMMYGDFYDYKLPDPRKDSTTRAFGMSCREIFRDLQREILGLQAGDVLEKEKCDKIIASICETYEHAVGEPVKVVTYDGPPATP
ncbi:hypothetical protein FOZ60_013587 [Perkinsus olseni]|uniref:Uncharacterized protein n=2 Tax=Perkinsus olseni TaxID=32597 RepID=A0A7J6N8Z6_PEROL|nr:hypothetical protein FOZ60_013587 [Perkinsus olseni]